MVADLVLTSSRIALALIFAMSAFGKALNVRTFQESISDFRLLPPSWSKAAAWGFLIAEFMVVVLMVVGSGVLLLAGFLLAAGLLAAFSGALLAALRRNPTTACNCFGRTEQPISFYDVARNVLLILCASAGVWALAEPARDLSAAGVALAGLIAVSFSLIVTSVRDVGETLRHPLTPPE